MKSAIHSLCMAAVVVLATSSASGDLPAFPDLSALGDFAIFGELGVALGPNNTILGGKIGSDSGSIFSGSGLVAPKGVSGGGAFFPDRGASVGPIIMNGSVGLDDYSSVEGRVDSGGDVFVGAYSIITGDITASGSVTVDPTASVGPDPGDPLRSFPGVTIPAPVTLTIPPGAPNVDNTAPGDPLVQELVPDTYYGDVTLALGSTLKLPSGKYVFNSFSADPGVTLDLPDGDVSIFVKTDVSILENFAVTTTGGGVANAYTNANWFMLGDDYWTGAIYAPNGSVFVGANSRINGKLYGSTVFTLADTAVVPVPPAILLGSIGLGLVARKRTSR